MLSLIFVHENYAIVVGCVVKSFLIKIILVKFFLFILDIFYCNVGSYVVYFFQIHLMAIFYNF